MSPESLAFMGILVGGLVTIVTTQQVQQGTTRRLMIDQQKAQSVKTETVGRKVDKSADSAEQAAIAAATAVLAAERAAANTVTVSNGTVPKILHHLEDQGAMMVRMIKQMDSLTEVSGRTRAAQDKTAGIVMEHLADHSRCEPKEAGT